MIGKKLIISLLFLSFVVASCGGGGSGSASTSSQPNTDFYFVKTEYSTVSDSVVSILKFNPAKGETVVDSGKAPIYLDDPLAGNYLYSGIGYVTVIPRIEFLPDGSGYEEKGLLGLFYVKDGDIMYYEDGMASPGVLRQKEKVLNLETLDPTIAGGGIVEVAAAFGDSIGNFEIRRYYISKSGNTLSADEGELVAPVVANGEVKGYLYSQEITPGTSFMKWLMYNEELTDPVELFETYGLNYIGQDGSNIYFQRVGVDEAGKFFYREIYELSKQEIPDASLQDVKDAKGELLSKRIYFKDLTNIENEAGIEYYFSNSWYSVGSRIYSSTFPECTRDDKLTCRYLYAVTHVTNPDYYKILGKYYVSDLKYSPLYSANFLFPISGGYLYSDYSDSVSEDGSITDREFSISLIDGSTSRDLVRFSLKDSIPYDIENYTRFKVQPMGVVGDRLYYIVEGEINGDYTGDPKPYPSQLTIVSAVDPTFGNVIYMDDYEFCTGDYRYDPNQGEYSYEDVRCGFDENKDGFIGDDGDVTCRDWNDNQQFDEGECRYVSARDLNLFYVCESPVDEETHGFCENMLYDLKSTDWGNWDAFMFNDVILLIRPFGDFIPPIVYDTKSGKEVELFASPWLEPFVTSVVNGVPRGFVMDWGAGDILIVDRNNRVIEADLGTVGLDLTREFDMDFAFSGDSVGILTDVYDPDKFVANSGSYNESFRFFYSSDGKLYEGFSIDSTPGEGSGAVTIDFANRVDLLDKIR